MIDFQFDSTTRVNAIKIASGIDEYTRQSVLNVVDSSIDAPKLIAVLAQSFADAGGPPQALRLDNEPEFISRVLARVCGRQVGLMFIPPGTPWNNGVVESFNNRLRRHCLNRKHWASLIEARAVIEDFKRDHDREHRHSSVGYLTPDGLAAHYRAQSETSH